MNEAPVVELDSSERKCPSCHAPMAFGPEQGALSCAYCSTTVPVERVSDVPVHPLGEVDRHAAASAHQRAVKCRHCGATTELRSHAVASACAFCASPLTGTDVVTVPPSEGIVPFAVALSGARKHFSSWLSGLWFRPNSLKRLATIQALRGVYVPAWSFAAQAHSSWTAEAGYHYYEEEEVEVSGRRETRRVQRTRWEFVSGDRSGAYDELLVSASQGLRIEEMDEVGPFDFSGSLCAFKGDFLAGFEAESPARGARESWPVALGWIREREHAACASDVPGDTHRNLSVRTSTSSEGFQSALVPVWIGTYAYGGKQWRVLVNGLSGKVAGDAPWSFWKISFAVLTTLAALAALYAFVIDPDVGRRWLGH